MAHNHYAPYRAQDHDEVSQMLSSLEEHAGKGKRKGPGNFSCRKSTFKVDGSNNTVQSWKLQDWDYKKPNLPTYARGLFTTRNANASFEIAIRGYDKFFNESEVEETQWQNIERDTRAPYVLSVKENGCIMFFSGLQDGTLLVCSKHSTGSRTDVSISHAKVGEEWIDRQLTALGKTRQDLAMRLRAMNATAVAELCDDEFEEHVLAYAPESAGLYLHGINLNLPDFTTYPHHLVDRFADEWGFKKTQYLIIDTIPAVKSFLERVAETGNYAGRDTEGFVIRCQSKARTGLWHDWFFKYKFEEPYLMYRQWRECTKAIISGKQPKIRKHRKITEEYLDFARQQLHRNHGLREAYQQNHGIIKLRTDFLASRGVKGSDIIAQERLHGDSQSNDVNRDIVLVPIASIGCGKTTVALGLSKLFGWGHVQNDNITVKKGKPAVFAHECCNRLNKVPATIADRNNHQRRERKQLMEDVSKIVPGALFVALHYVHDHAAYDSIRAQTRNRVLCRGDNHQTIRTGSKGTKEIIDIMEGFLYRFEPVNDQEAPDDNFDTVINLDVCATSRTNLETIIMRLYAEYPNLFAGQDMPSADDIDSAIEEALNDYTVDVKHDIKAGSDKNDPRVEQYKSSPAKAIGNRALKERKLEYFAVQLPATPVGDTLEAMFAHAPTETARMFNTLKALRRVQSEFHVTLIHRAAANEHAGYWSTLTDLHDHAISRDGKLGLCDVKLERLVWDDRIMAFVVRLIPAASSPVGWHSVNSVAHVTIGTSSTSVKPVESNDLLSKWLIEGCTESNHLMDMMVKGCVELEGVVKGVLQDR